MHEYKPLELGDKIDYFEILYFNSGDGYVTREYEIKKDGIFVISYSNTKWTVEPQCSFKRKTYNISALSKNFHEQRITPSFFKDTLQYITGKGVIALPTSEIIATNPAYLRYVQVNPGDIIHVKFIANEYETWAKTITVFETNDIPCENCDCRNVYNVFATVNEDVTYYNGNPKYETTVFIHKKGCLCVMSWDNKWGDVIFTKYTNNEETVKDILNVQQYEDVNVETISTMRITPKLNYMLTKPDNLSENYKIDYLYVQKGDVFRFYAENSADRDLIFAVYSDIPQYDMIPVQIIGITPCIDNNGTWKYETYIHIEESGYLAYYWFNGGVYTERKLQKLVKNTSSGSSTEQTMDDRLSLISNAKFKTNSSKCFGLMHYSDIHADDIAKEDIMYYYNKYKTNVDDMLCTGDSTHYYYNSTSAYPGGAEWWTESVLAQKSLFVIGNHDPATENTTSYDTKEGSAAWNGMGKDWTYNTYFKPFSDALGVTKPSGVETSGHSNYHACYWYKDYPAYKIRLIGLDCLNRYDGYKHKTKEQENWLTSVLNETITSSESAYGYSVLFACHYLLDELTVANEQYDDNKHKWIYNKNQNGGYVIGKTHDTVNFHTKYM